MMLALLLVAVAFDGHAANAEEPPTAREAVATVLSMLIYDDQLEPSAAWWAAQLSTLDQEQREAARVDYRSQQLSALLLQPLRQHFCQTHPCAPTSDELESYHATMHTDDLASGKAEEDLRTKLTTTLQGLAVDDPQREPMTQRLQRVEQSIAREQQLRASLSPTEREAHVAAVSRFIQQFAAAAVWRWKFHQALYQQYGGAVIWQQADGPEPVGAYRAWLQESERAGAFEIFDTDLRARFWASFLKDHPFVVEEPNPFDIPWWLKPPAQQPSQTRE